MITHLRNAGKLDSIRGVVMADMAKCDGLDGFLWDVVGELFENDQIPVVYGLASGHGETCITLPLGRNVDLNADDGCLSFIH